MCLVDKLLCYNHYISHIVLRRLSRAEVWPFNVVSIILFQIEHDEAQSLKNKMDESSVLQSIHNINTVHTLVPYVVSTRTLSKQIK